MLKIGIVAEYNPFHNGHLYQIRKIKEIFGEDVLIVVVISGDFVQRGEISFLDKWEKTQVSLGCGVDLVVELPLYYSIQNAEIFSRMATKILDYLGIDIQVFGAEEENIEVLQKVLELQKRQDYKDKLMEYMKKGNSYSTSQRLALKEYNLDGIVKSNNILALEYMREIENSNLKIKPYIIKREISEYNEEKVSEGYITGDIYYHTAQDMLSDGLLALDPGHYIEVLFVEKIASFLNEWKEENAWSLEVIASQASTNPFHHI